MHIARNKVCAKKKKKNQKFIKLRGAYSNSILFIPANSCFNSHFTAKFTATINSPWKICYIYPQNAVWKFPRNFPRNKQTPSSLRGKKIASHMHRRLSHAISVLDKAPPKKETNGQSLAREMKNERRLAWTRALVALSPSGHRAFIFSRGKKMTRERKNMGRKGIFIARASAAIGWMNSKCAGERERVDWMNLLREKRRRTSPRDGVEWAWDLWCCCWTMCV